MSLDNLKPKDDKYELLENYIYWLEDVILHNCDTSSICDKYCPISVAEDCFTYLDRLCLRDMFKHEEFSRQVALEDNLRSSQESQSVKEILRQLKEELKGDIDNIEL